MSDVTYRRDYTSFMEDIIRSGYAEEISANESESDNTQYISHHGVYHKVEQKILMVFDCSAKYQGECLNKHQSCCKVQILQIT